MTPEERVALLCIQARRHIARGAIGWAEWPGRWPRTELERLALEAAVKAVLMPAVLEAIDDGIAATRAGLPELAEPIAVTIWREAGRRAAQQAMGGGK